MKKKRYWWPLELSDDIEIALTRHEEEMSSANIAVDASLSKQTELALANFVAKPAAEIVAKDKLPELCHLYVGWGNCTYDASALLDRLSQFVHLDAQGRPYIYQCHAEGDFHPWQSFAYLMMAGVDLQEKVGNLSFTIREIAMNSTIIRTRAMDDLGHLMYAFAELDLPFDLAFEFRGRRLFEETDLSLTQTMAELVPAAIQAHRFGPFFVCRKFHLTGGLCAVAQKYSEHFVGAREIAQRFLDGQMDILLALSLATREIENISKGKKSLADNGLASLRKGLLVGSLLENHVFVGGHLVELAAHAIRYGFEISTAHRNAIAQVVNHLNGAILRAIPRMSPHDAFLPLGHYRRAITMYAELQNIAGFRENERAAMRRYTANLDLATAYRPSPVESSTESLAIDAQYTRAKTISEMRARLEDVLSDFTKQNSTGLSLQGGYSHFRRLHPPEWPRQLHFEFLDYGDAIGVELHFENARLLPLVNALSDRIAELKNMHPHASVVTNVDENKEGASLKMLFEDAISNVEEISKAMCAFVAVLRPIVDTLLADGFARIELRRASQVEAKPLFAS